MKDKRLCKTPRCKNKKQKGHLVCDKCRTRQYRKKHPAKAAYLNLKFNAKRRGKVFTLTFEDFLTFCYQYNYLQGKGRTKQSLTVDRIDNNLGYVPGNIQVLTNSENVAKRNKTLVYDYQTKYAKVI